MVYSSNFQVLHWLAEGESFLAIHAKSEEYYKKVSSDIDKVAELILRRENKIVNYREALEIMEEDEHNFLLIDSTHPCDMEYFKDHATKMFNDILYCITKILDDIDCIAVKSSLESMYDEYHLQANYILKRLK